MRSSDMELPSLSEGPLAQQRIFGCARRPGRVLPQTHRAGIAAHAEKQPDEPWETSRKCNDRRLKEIFSSF